MVIRCGGKTEMRLKDQGTIVIAVSGYKEHCKLSVQGARWSSRRQGI